MSSPELSAILEDLAAGRIDAGEAARRIDEAKANAGQPARATTPGGDDRERHRDTDGWAAGAARPASNNGNAKPDDVVPPSQRQGSRGGVDKIVVRAVGRRVRILGDYSVTTLAAEGPHVLRRNGSVMEVSSDGEIGPTLDGFSMLRPPRNLDDIRAMSLGKELLIRVNPGIVVDAEVTAGSLKTEKVPYLGKIRVTAGGAKLEGIAEISDALIQAGQCTIDGSIRTGRSRIRCESGTLTLTLDESSNVTVKGEAQLGRLVWGGRGVDDQKLGEYVLGQGSAHLDVEVVMGQGNLRLGEETVR